MPSLAAARTLPSGCQGHGAAGAQEEGPARLGPPPRPRPRPVPRAAEGRRSSGRAARRSTYDHCGNSSSQGLDGGGSAVSVPPRTPPRQFPPPQRRPRQFPLLPGTRSLSHSRPLPAAARQFPSLPRRGGFGSVRHPPPPPGNTRLRKLPPPPTLRQPSAISGTRARHFPSLPCNLFLKIPVPSVEPAEHAPELKPFLLLLFSYVRVR